MTNRTFDSLLLLFVVLVIGPMVVGLWVIATPVAHLSLLTFAFLMVPVNTAVTLAWAGSVWFLVRAVRRD